MNEVAKIDTSRAVAVQGEGSLAALAKLADAMNQRYLRGTILKFRKGDYFAGQDDDEVPAGTQFVLNYDNWLHGWIRWSDKKPSDQIMESVMLGNKTPKRDTLPDNDQDEWETDDNGKPQDPWQESHYLLLKDPKQEGEESLYTLTTSSKTGRNSMWKFLKQAVGKFEMHPHEYPIVALVVDYYDDDTYGRIKFPSLKIVGWSQKSVFNNAMAEEAATAEAQATADRELAEFGDKLGKKPVEDDAIDAILGPASAKAKASARF
jgi:hypothetical protein